MTRAKVQAMTTSVLQAPRFQRRKVGDALVTALNDGFIIRTARLPGSGIAACWKTPVTAQSELPGSEGPEQIDARLSVPYPMVRTCEPGPLTAKYDSVTPGLTKKPTTPPPGKSFGITSRN